MKGKHDDFGNQTPNLSLEQRTRSKICIINVDINQHNKNHRKNYLRDIHPQTPYASRMTEEDRRKDPGCSGCYFGCFIGAALITGLAGFAIYKISMYFLNN